MKLHKKPKTTERKSKRIGRGYGSGKGGHTTVRGQKGQKSRGSIPQWFVGTSWVWFKRLPMLKGKGKFKPSRSSTKIVSFRDLGSYKSGETVNEETLIKKGVLSEREAKSNKLKLVATGKLDKKIKVEISASKGAIKQVEKLGGEYISENR